VSDESITGIVRLRYSATAQSPTTPLELRRERLVAADIGNAAQRFPMFAFAIGSVADHGAL
jgi:hypothetical protein